MIRSLSALVAVSCIVLSTVVGCAVEAEPTPAPTPTTEKTDDTNANANANANDEVPTVDTDTVETTISRPCIPQKFPICANGFSCLCRSGVRVCYCNDY